MENTNIPKREPVVQKAKVQTKTPKMRISEDTSHVLQYVVNDILIPTVKKTVDDIVSNGIHMMLYGNARNNAPSGGRPTNKVQYVNFFGNRQQQPSSPVRYADRSRSDANCDDIIFYTREDAELALRDMTDDIRDYGVTTMAALYENAGLKVPYTGHDYGWTNIRGAEIVPVRDGWMIKLPRVTYIK